MSSLVFPPAHISSQVVHHRWPCRLLVLSRDGGLVRRTARQLNYITTTIINSAAIIGRSAQKFQAADLPRGAGHPGFELGAAVEFSAPGRRVVQPLNYIDASSAIIN